MDFRRVDAALEAIGLRDQYIGDFRENCLEDDTIDLKDPDIVSTLKDIMPKPGNRVKFMKAFKAVVVPTMNNTKRDTTGEHSVKTLSVTSSQSDGPDEEWLQVTHSQDSGHPPPYHAEYASYKGFDFKGDNFIGDVDSKMSFLLGSVRKLEVSKGEHFGHTNKKLKMEVKNIQFNTRDPISFAFSSYNKHLYNILTYLLLLSFMDHNLSDRIQRRRPQFYKIEQIFKIYRNNTGLEIMQR